MKKEQNDTKQQVERKRGKGKDKKATLFPSETTTEE